MRRFRVKVTVPLQSPRVTTTTFTNPCRLCAAAAALRIVTNVADTFKVKPETIEWTLERLTGAPDRWEIEMTNRSRLHWLIARHGC